MNIITKEQLQSLTAGMSLSGVVLIKGYNVALTRGGKEYISGKVQSGTDVMFKAWGSSAAFAKLKNEAYENVPAYIIATGDDYGGNMSLVLESVQAVEGFTPDQFFPVKYNIDAYWEALQKLIVSEVTPKGQELCGKILFANEDVANRFKVEFAASSHHDNCKGGLLAHTYKVVTMIQRVVSMYPTLVSRDGVQDPDKKDLLYIGALLHDVGKVREMEFGVYQPISCSTHKYLGSEMLMGYKQEIVAGYGEQWYYDLISIILQHHGEFGEPPKTVWARIVHLADAFDAYMTSMGQMIEAVNGEGKIKVDGNYLSI